MRFSWGHRGPGEAQKPASVHYPPNYFEGPTARCRTVATASMAVLRGFIGYLGSVEAILAGREAVTAARMAAAAWLKELGDARCHLALQMSKSSFTTASADQPTLGGLRWAVSDID